MKSQKHEGENQPVEAASELSAGLGESERKLKELDIKWGIEYGILRDSFDDLRNERDCYMEALRRVSNEAAEAAICKIADEALRRKPFDDEGTCDLGMEQHYEGGW